MSIIVFTENRGGKIKKNAFEAVSYASQVAQQTGAQVIAISVGQVEDDELALLAKYGANKIVSVSNEKFKYEDTQAFAKLIADIFNKENANISMFSHSNMGKAIAPRLAVKLKAGLAAGVISLPESVNPFVVKRKTYNGSAFLNIKINSVSKVLTINANSCDVIANQCDVNIEKYEPETDDSMFKTNVTEVDLVTGKILLSEADIVVAGGRGMKSGDNWKPLEELAELLGAGLACSRPVSDEHWRPHDEHVGQTGKIIAPNLYLAFGISGAIQHIGGVSASKVMVAVDKDKDAPIFSYADYGIVGDAFEVLPRLIESVKKFKAQ
jgi:electron transfer flavoprotein alpha subunit